MAGADGSLSYGMVRLLDDALALVEPDRLDIDARRAGDLADGQHCVHASPRPQPTRRTYVRSQAGIREVPNLGSQLKL